MTATGQWREAFERLGAATVGESGGSPMRASVRPAWPGARVAGPALPVVCTPGDNLAVHVALTRAEPGTVLVVDVGDEPERGYWGEVLTTAAQHRGVAGLVIGGGVRDVDALRRLRFPVFCTLISLRGATKQHAGSVGGVAHVGGVDVAVGDWIVADPDGVTVVPGGRLDDVLAAAEARERRERHLFDELRAGRTTVDLLDLDPAPVEVHAPR